MRQISSDEAYKIAEEFRNLAGSVNVYRIKEGPELTPEQRDQIEKMENSLRNQASEFIASGITAALDKVEETVEDIIKTTNDMTAAVDKLRTVAKVITVASCAIALSGALLSGNPIAIASALADAKNAIA